MCQKEPIRVLHVIGVMNRGGAETMIMNLYRNIDRNKIQFDFVEHTDKRAVFDDEIESLGGVVYRCPKFTGKNYFTYKKWWDNFFTSEGAKYRIVHGHIGSTAAIYLKSAKKYGKYTIIHSHNTKASLSFKEFIYRFLSHIACNYADYFFACSKLAGIDRFGKKINFSVLNNAIFTEHYTFSDSTRREVRDELGLNNEYVIGHIGRFNYQKNHSFLIDIFKELKKKNDEVKLILVGDGEEIGNVKNKVMNYGLEKDVIFTGVRSDVNKLLQAMDVFLFPSLFEGLPVTIVEAQAAGLPCVISNKVPDECIIIEGLVTIKKLSDSAEDWASHILTKKYFVRIDTSEEIKNKGFDINESTKLMEDFYSIHG